MVFSGMEGEKRWFKRVKRSAKEESRLNLCMLSGRDRSYLEVLLGGFLLDQIFLDKIYIQ